MDDNFVQADDGVVKSCVGMMVNWLKNVEIGKPGVSLRVNYITQRVCVDLPLPSCTRMAATI